MESIVINARNAPLSSGNTTGFFVMPVRGVAGTANLRYNSVTGEITYDASVRRNLVAVSEGVEVEDVVAAEAARVWELRPVVYRHALEAKTAHNNDKAYGFVAEEVAAIDPRLVHWGEDGQVEGVDYEQMVPLILQQAKALKETHEGQIRALKEEHDARLQALEEKVTALLR
jgi:hypothetical protein